MTVKEISIFCGCSERTVQRWIKKASAKMSSVADKMSVAGHGRVVDYNMDEVECILRYSSLGYDVVLTVMENARKSGLSGTEEKYVAQSNTTPVEVMMAKVAETFSAIALAVQDNSKRITAIENQIMQKPGICLPAPQITPRKHISMIIREYVARTGDTYSNAWNELYRQYSYRTGIDVRKRAKNREMDVLDYIELEGQMEILQSIAIEIFIEKVENGLGGHNESSN